MNPLSPPVTNALISQTSEYALRAVLHLAQRADGPIAALEIAEAIVVPVGYLQKILRMLARAGILHAQRGAGGGFSLTKVPSAISLLDVLSATDTDVSRIERCPLGISGHTKLCSLHRLLDKQIAGVRHTFATTSIADLLSEDGTDHSLCTPTQPTTPTVKGEPSSRPKRPRNTPS